MPKTTHASPLAKSYAEALIQLAAEQNQLEPLGQEMRDLRHILSSNPTLGLILADPGFAEAERAGLIDRIFSGQVSNLLLSFLKLVNSKGRLGLLDQIAVAYEDLLDQRVGKIELDVTVAHKLSDEELETVRQRVSQALGKDAVVHQYIDDSIIGGLILRVGDRLIDASVRYQLRAMKQRLLAARPAGA